MALDSDDVGIEDKRYKVGRQFFIYAPPFRGVRDKETGEYKSKRLRSLEMPFFGAEPYQYSIYYFWWEFLKRHDGYRKCCETGGSGKYAKLYADFGNIHEHDDFWKWWNHKVDTGSGLILGRGEYLFAEGAARRIQVSEQVVTTGNDDMLTLHLPLEVRTPYLLREIRQILQEHKHQVSTARKKSRANYPVSAGVKVGVLYQTLKVWDLWQEHKNKGTKKYEVCDLAECNYNNKVEGLTVRQWQRQYDEGVLLDDSAVRDARNTVNTRKTQAVNRYLKAAEDYIHFAGLGEFPKRRERESISRSL